RTRLPPCPSTRSGEAGDDRGAPAGARVRTAARRLGGRVPRRRAHPLHACGHHGDLRGGGGGTDLVVREAPERTGALLARDPRLARAGGRRRGAGPVLCRWEGISTLALRCAPVLLVSKWRVGSVGRR